jgi:hypothetical protein
MTEREERSASAGITLKQHIFAPATYVMNITLKAKSKELANPKEEVKVRFFVECMQHVPGRVTTSVSRVITLENNILMWKGEKFDILNYDEVVEVAKKMLDGVVFEDIT